MRHFFIIFLFYSLSGFGQSNLKFLETTHRFGDLYKNEEVSHNYIFVNQGEDSVSIVNVKSTCECIEAVWNTSKIPPNASDSITVYFDASDRLGAFHKRIYAINDKGSSTALYMTGYVINSANIISKFPAHFGNLFLPYNILNMGSIWHHKAVEKEFKIYNNSDSVMTFLIASSIIPDFIRLRITPNTLPPKSFGTIILNYDPLQRSDLGFLRDGLIINTTDKDMPSKMISVVATIEEYFQNEESNGIDSANYPVLECSVNNIDFGKISSKQSSHYTLNLYNKGIDLLSIRMIKSNCGCIEWNLEKKNIVGGDSTILKIILNPQNRKGRQFKNLTLFTNDPLNATHVIPLEALIP